MPQPQSGVLPEPRESALFRSCACRILGTSGDGLHDRRMESSQAVSGGTFIAPSLRLIRSLFPIQIQTLVHHPHHRLCPALRARWLAVSELHRVNPEN